VKKIIALSVLTLASCGAAANAADTLIVFMGDSITAHWDMPKWQVSAADPLYTMPGGDILSNLKPGGIIDVGIPGQTVRADGRAIPDGRDRPPPEDGRDRMWHERFVPRRFAEYSVRGTNGRSRAGGRHHSRARADTA
jgi:hypothetical protein